MADPDPSITPPPDADLKFVAIFARKEGISREEFLRAWMVDHIQLSHACPAIKRYVLTPIQSSSARPGMPSWDIEADGLAELYFANQADFETFSNSPATTAFRAHGETFIGRQINFVTYEKIVIPGPG
jgi:uncharacterized protein (TIGR02118 family)